MAQPLMDQLLMNQSLRTHSLKDQLNPPLESFEAYRAARQVARITTITSVVLGLTTIASTAAIICLFPLKEVRPMLVTIKDKGEQVVHIEPIDKNVKALEQLKETLARQYVKLRETFDLQSESERWKQVALMSSTELARVFHETMKLEAVDSPLKKRMHEQTIRSVQILSSSSIGREYWITTMTVSLEERSFEYADQYINPIGFTVKHYTVARKDGLNLPAAGKSLAPEEQDITLKNSN